jgi:hypothetical protein
MGTIEVAFDRSPIDIDASTPIDQLRLVVDAERWTPDDE